MNFDNQGVIVPDCSFYQDDDTTPQKIDFEKMKAAGAVGVILRAGQNTWRDEDFADYWTAAKDAGLPRGSYWFYDSRAEPGAQADLWKSQIGTDLPELGLWIDLEESYHGTWKGESNWKVFCEAVKLKFPGVLVGIYTANWWWQNQSVTDPLYFSRYPLWVAQYVSTPLYVVLPRPWDRCVLWQYTATGDGLKYGVESLGIDLNKWNGTLEEFRAFFGLDAPETGEPTVAKNKVTVTWDQGARERQEPHASGVYGNTLPDNSIHYSDFDPVPDKDDPGNVDKRWIKLQSGWYIATRYPSSGGIVERARVEAVAPEVQEFPEFITAHFANGADKKYIPE